MQFSENVRGDEATRLKHLIQAALNDITENHGYHSVKLDGGDFRFSPGGNICLNVKAVLKDGLSAEAERYEHWQELEAEDLPPLGSELVMKPGGPIHRVVGINTTATKIIVQSAGGSRYPIEKETAKMLVKIFKGDI